MELQCKVNLNHVNQNVILSSSFFHGDYVDDNSEWLNCLIFYMKYKKVCYIFCCVCFCFRFFSVSLSFKLPIFISLIVLRLIKFHFMWIFFFSFLFINIVKLIVVFFDYIFKVKFKLLSPKVSCWRRLLIVGKTKPKRLNNWTDGRQSLWLKSIINQKRLLIEHPNWMDTI